MYSSVLGLFDESAGLCCSADFVFELKTPDIYIYSSERCFYSEELAGEAEWNPSTEQSSS